MNWFKGRRATSKEELLSEMASLSGLRPATFTEFLAVHRSDSEKELLDGAVVDRMPTYGEHDNLLAWMQQVLTEFLKARKFGTLYDAQTPIRVSDYRARRADLAFLCRENGRVAKNGALQGTPDVVIEIASSSDLRSDLLSREADYKALGIPEIIFLDPTRHQGRIIRRRPIEMTYDEEAIGPDGIVKIKALNLVLLMEWLVHGTYPEVSDVMSKIVHPLQRRM